LYGTDATAVSDSDTALGNQVFEAGIDSYSVRSTGIIDLIERLGSGEANGNDIAELGQHTSDDTLLSRVVIEPISKTSSFDLRVRHRLSAENV